MEKIKLFKAADLFIILAAAAVSILFAFVWFWAQEDTGRLAVIEVDGQVFRTVDMDSLEEEIRVQTDGDVSVTVVVSPDGAYVEHSDCKDKICVNTGVLSRAGQVSVCLPTRVSLSIRQDRADSDSLPDAVTG